jgi:hypothetical protein
MRGKIFFLFYFLLIAGFAYWAYPIVKDRYFESGVENPSLLETIGKSGAFFADITKENCDSKCVDSNNNKDAIEYCNQICGFVPMPKKLPDCSNLKNLKKDYCLRDLAIFTKNSSICSDIIDEGIKKICTDKAKEL